MLLPPWEPAVGLGLHFPRTRLLREAQQCVERRQGRSLKNLRATPWGTIRRYYRGNGFRAFRLLLQSGKLSRMRVFMTSATVRTDFTTMFSPIYVYIFPFARD